MYGPGPSNNCSVGVMQTSETAVLHGCKYAMNGGPFNNRKKPYGQCSGLVISDGVEATSVYGSGVGFGVTSNFSFVFGTLSNASEAAALQVQQFVTGFSWLVYDSQNLLKPGGSRAPRTAAGVTHDGRLIMLEVDGCEKCKSGKGPTEYELADLLVDLGAVVGINMDGGGSSTVVVDDKVVNWPTCVDVFLKCQRKVTTIMCVK